MLFEQVLPALRAGKKVRRDVWADDLWMIEKNGTYVDSLNTEVELSAYAINCDGWKIVPEPKRVADYLVRSEWEFRQVLWTPKEVPSLPPIEALWCKRTFEVGTQPDGAVLIPDSEREVG